ncbi:Hypothetical predicted protein, partial [Pelobates cultripes]
PVQFLLQLLPQNATKPVKFLTYHILIAALRTIGKNWLSPHTSATDMCPIHRDIHKYEYMARKAETNQKFWIEAWDLWDQCIERKPRLLQDSEE